MLIPKPLYEAVREPSVAGRYVTLNHIVKVLEAGSNRYQLSVIGESVLGRPLYSIKIGKGEKRVLMWSQMHGNESTATKAILDLLSFLGRATAVSGQILEQCTLCILPMLNPDGAEAYTRVNANGADLNRDAQRRNQPESKALRDVFDKFDPGFCFNLHDQRTLFNVGTTPQPATLSFLSPAEDEARTLTDNRRLSMQLIGGVNTVLQTLIPGRIGRYDDSFNLDCVGDTFQSLHTPTILIEAGHSPGDYEREDTRYYFYEALSVALQLIALSKIDGSASQEYFNIPENGKQFLDIIVRHPHLLNARWPAGMNVGLRYEECLSENRINLNPVIEEKGQLRDKFAHTTYDCQLHTDLRKIKENKLLFELLN